MSSILDKNPVIAKQVSDIAEVSGYLWERGWAERNGGNISVDLTDDLSTDDLKRMSLFTADLPKPFPTLAGRCFYFTGTNRRMRDVAKRPMQHGCILRISATGKQYYIISDEPVIPTSEIASHLTIHAYMRYVSRRGIRAVCHTHPTDLIALSHNPSFLREGALTKLLWSMLPEVRIVVPKGLGIVRYQQPGTIELANETIRQLTQHDCLLWEKHGCLAVGESVIEAFDMIDTLSKAAQIYQTALSYGFVPEGISEENMEGLVQMYKLP